MVAITTGLLAVATGVLAWMTRRLAQNAADQAKLALEELAAQMRPVLIPNGTPTWRAMEEGAIATRLHVAVQNAGHGPAIFLRVKLDGPGGRVPFDFDRGALAPGEVQQFEFDSGDHTMAPFRVLMDYRDLSGRDYATAITLSATGSSAHVYQDVEILVDATITGLPDVRQLALPRLDVRQSQKP
jgi:hypothetical protein